MRFDLLSAAVLLSALQMLHPSGRLALIDLVGGNDSDSCNDIMKTRNLVHISD